MLIFQWCFNRKFHVATWGGSSPMGQSHASTSGGSLEIGGKPGWELLESEMILLMVQKSGEKTTRDGAKNHVNNGIFYISTGDRRISEPSTVDFLGLYNLFGFSKKKSWCSFFSPKKSFAFKTEVDRVDFEGFFRWSHTRVGVYRQMEPLKDI